MSLPTVTIIGNLTRDPELQITGSGVARCTFTVAANERRKNADGQWEDGDATFLRVTAWRQAAESAAESLSRGSKVVVIGRLRSRVVETETGKQTYFDLDADTIALDVTRTSSMSSKVQRIDGPVADDIWTTPF